MSYPTEDQVLAGVPFGPSDEFTGNVLLPSTGDVRKDVIYGSTGDAQVGTLDVDAEANLPAAENVALGIVYGSTFQFTGTSAIPNPINVLNGIAVGQVFGTLLSPSVGNVRSGTIFGPGPAYSTGTLVVPSVGNVRLGTQYSASPTLTGTLIVPTVDTVLSGTVYSASPPLTGALLPNPAPIEMTYTYDPTGGDTAEVITIVRNDTRSLQFSADPSTSILGWTFSFTLTPVVGQTPFDGFPLTTENGGITVTDSATGALTVNVTNELSGSIPRGSYVGSLRRTNSGYERTLLTIAVLVEDQPGYPT